jgi:hypothetical protein
LEALKCHGFEVALDGPMPEREPELVAPTSNANILALRNIPESKPAAGNSGAIRGIFAFAYIWFCLVKLPATSLRDSLPQSWEAVLSYAAAHHLQWGRDVVFTFGPLGFLTSDYYWGSFLWPIVLWAGGFALAMTAALMPFLARMPKAIRLPFYVAVPLLTVPVCSDLGFDSFHFLAITLLGTLCLPGERPGTLRLTTTGFVFTVLSLIKFTFCIYSIFVILVIVTANGRAWRNTAIFIGSSLLSLFGICWWSGQSLWSVFLYVGTSTEMAAGYSAAMGLAPTVWDARIGVALLAFLVALVLTTWLGSRNWRERTHSVVIVCAGIFLAWKEGFVRAEAHVVVFLVYSFFLAALLPALLGFDWVAEELDERENILSAPVGNMLLRRRARALIFGCMFFSLTPFAAFKGDFKLAVQNGLLARTSDTFSAFIRPATYKLELERQLESMRDKVELPEIRSIVGGDAIDALNLDQDAAILNGLNYKPHPVFQNYSAYTPALQRLNAEFFKSKRPQYLLWRTGSIDGRFPTLDDGEVVLTILSSYSPVTNENGLILWKCKSLTERPYCLTNKHEFSVSLNQWVALPREPTWLQIESEQTLFGATQSLLSRYTEMRLEVQLDNGGTRSYRLLPGNARYGFVISPFLYTSDQLLTAEANTNCARIVSARVRAANERAVAPSIRFVTHTIQGVWASRPEQALPSSEPSLQETSKSHAAPTEPGEGPRDVGSYRHGAPTELLSSNAPASNIGAANTTNAIATAQKSTDP